jgi:hypothetical protein
MLLVDLFVFSQADAHLFSHTSSKLLILKITFNILLAIELKRLCIEITRFLHYDTREKPLKYDLDSVLQIY